MSVMIIKIAKICHSVNKAYCETLGDFSQLSWEQSPDWQKDSAINGVQVMFDNPATTPEMSHESWVKQKLDDGWVYGAGKDPVAKTHHCIVPYDKLPLHQKIKDELFRSIVKVFLDQY